LGGRDDPCGEPARLAAAHSLELAVLQHAQEATLQRGVELADLVEKERAAPARSSARSGARPRP
jgi:hypothetical protein